MKYKWFFSWLLIKYISWLKICKNKQSEYNQIATKRPNAKTTKVH